MVLSYTSGFFVLYSCIRVDHTRPTRIALEPLRGSKADPGPVTIHVGDCGVYVLTYIKQRFRVIYTQVVAPVGTQSHLDDEKGTVISTPHFTVPYPSMRYLSERAYEGHNQQVLTLHTPVRPDHQAHAGNKVQIKCMIPRASLSLRQCGRCIVLDSTSE